MIGGIVNLIYRAGNKMTGMFLIIMHSIIFWSRITRSMYLWNAFYILINKKIIKHIVELLQIKSNAFLVNNKEKGNF